MTLYELTEQMAALDALLEVADDTEAVRALQDSLLMSEGELEAKLESYARLIRNYEVQADMRDEEAERLRSRATSARNRARQMKDAVKCALEALGRAQINTGPFTFSIQLNGGSRHAPEAEMKEHVAVLAELYNEKDLKTWVPCMDYLFWNKHDAWRDIVAMTKAEQRDLWHAATWRELTL